MMIESGTPSSHRITPRIDKPFLSPRTQAAVKAPSGDSNSPAEVLSCRKRTDVSPQDQSTNAMVAAKFPAMQTQGLVRLRVAETGCASWVAPARNVRA